MSVMTEDLTLDIQGRRHDHVWVEGGHLYPTCEACQQQRREIDIIAPPLDFKVIDTGKRQEFASGMVRNAADDKVDYTSVLDGPMFERWAAHLTKAKKIYPDVAPGVANWTLADGEEELVRFKKSFLRHAVQWLRGDVDEDHAAAVMFNINGAELVKAKLAKKKAA